MKEGWISSEFIVKSVRINNTIISGYASVFEITDSQNDRIVKGAFSNTKTANVKLLWQHDITKPIGIITFLQEDQYGLRVEAEINNKILAGSEATELIKQKAICGLSVGFTIKSSDYNKQGIRVIQEAELMEISVVTFPSNSQAQINHVKHKSIQDNNSNPLEKLKKLINQLENH